MFGDWVPSLDTRPQSHRKELNAAVGAVWLARL
jgi:hypothetical protein